MWENLSGFSNNGVESQGCSQLMGGISVVLVDSGEILRVFSVDDEGILGVFSVDWGDLRRYSVDEGNLRVVILKSWRNLGVFSVDGGISWVLVDNGGILRVFSDDGEGILGLFSVDGGISGVFLIDIKVCSPLMLWGMSGVFSVNALGNLRRILGCCGESQAGSLWMLGEFRRCSQLVRRIFGMYSNDIGEI